MKTALFLLLAIYLIVPIFLFRLNNRRVAKFCLYMTASQKTRMFFCYILLLAVIYFHFVFFQSFKTEYGLMFSTILLIAMFSTKLTEKILVMLVDDNRKLYAFTISTLVLAFIPHMLSLAITMVILLVGASFYPSSRIRQCDQYFLFAYYNESARKRDFRDFVEKYFC